MSNKRHRVYDKKYNVYIDDNFHYMDEDERIFRNSFDSYEEAVAECKKIVDRSLWWLKGTTYPKPETSEELYNSYLSFGDDPFVYPREDDNEQFSAWSYAKSRIVKTMNTKEPIEWPTFSWPTFKRSPKPKRKRYFCWLDFVAIAAVAAFLSFAVVAGLWSSISFVMMAAFVLGTELWKARRR